MSAKQQGAVQMSSAQKGLHGEGTSGHGEGGM